MLRFLLNKILLKSSPSIKAVNLTHKYIQNIRAIALASGVPFNLNAKALAPKNKKLYVLDFNGDSMASRTENFAEEISAIINFANKKFDTVLIRLNSPGGAAHAYGYAASQIERLRDAGIHVTVSVDRVAASGGYMMACVADEIISAPYAIIGSIGVVAEFPNFSRLLKDLGIDYKQYTAGKYKRTVSTFAEMDEEGEAEFVRDLEDMHLSFKEHVGSFRKSVNIEEISNGKTWIGKKALEKGLVDKVMTSEEFLMEKILDSDIVKIDYVNQRNSFENFLVRRASLFISDVITAAFYKVISNLDVRWK